MLEVIRQQAQGESGPEAKINKAREFLQIIALKILYDKDYFRQLVFTGGTALRILFDLRRFSEDLDFSIADVGGYDLNQWGHDLERGYIDRGLLVEVGATGKENNAVQGVMLKFTGIHKVLGISAPKDQKLSIKLEVDTNPPQGGHTVQTLINKTYLFTVTHFDISSLFATKLHAVLFRKYTKGRDIYDLIWYLSKKVKPNLDLLNNAIEQTQKKNPYLNEETLKPYLLAHIDNIDFNLAQKDVERFLMDKTELKLFDRDILKGAISSWLL